MRCQTSAWISGRSMKISCRAPGRSRSAPSAIFATWLRMMLDETTVSSLPSMTSIGSRGSGAT